MTTTTDLKQRVLQATGLLALTYAVVGNYIALPGYIRFLERGGTSDAGNAFDMDVLIGATKTIAWMHAFNIAAACFYLGSLRRHAPDHVKIGLAVVVCWLLFWSIPALPRPGPVFFIVCGLSILVSIAWLAHSVSAGLPTITAGRSFVLMTGFFFLAVGTWDICGLGSVGRILHPEQVVLPRSQLLLQTQVIKLMLAFLLGWGLIAAAASHRTPSVQAA